MQAPPPLEAALDSATRRDLRNVVGAHARTLDEWLAGWRDGLLRFDAERSQPKDAWSAGTQHRHDWVGLLYLRDIIEAELRQRASQVPPRALAWLAEVDDFLRSFTEEVENWAPATDAGTGWWWRRLPVDSPVRAGWWGEE